MAQVMQACRTMRCVLLDTEQDIHEAVAQALVAHDILFLHEYRLMPRCRIDFWTSQKRIGIEVKKGKPRQQMLIDQVVRYCASDQIDGLIMVVERCIEVHPHVINGKPVEYLSLSKLFGVAV
jgi:hypothetical protein